MSDKSMIIHPSTLQEAINIIKFLNTSHKQELAKWKEAYQRQAAKIKKLESNRKKELEFLSQEIINYEMNLASRSETIATQLKEKDNIIKQQLETIEELNEKLKMYSPVSSLPEITVVNFDCHSDSGIALESEDIAVNDRVEGATKGEAKRKCSRRFAESILFLRRVDFTSRKYKANRDSPKQDSRDESKNNKLEIPSIQMSKRTTCRPSSLIASDDDRSVLSDPPLSEGSVENLVFKPRLINDSMNNHFSDDGSDDTSEEVFDRVMTRSSTRRSIKSNPKYKKINRTKSKLLEQVKNNIVD